MWTEAAISSQFLCRAEGGCEFRELPLVMPPSKVCPQCNAVVPIRLKVCRNRLKFALYNADRVNFKSRNYHVVAYNISILAEGLHFSALVGSAEEFLQTYRKAQGTPQTKYSYPQTEAQEIGWDTKPLV